MALALYVRVDNWQEILAQKAPGGAGTADLLARLAGAGIGISDEGLFYGSLKDTLAPKLAAEGLQCTLVVVADDGAQTTAISPALAAVGGALAGFLGGQLVK